MNIICLAKFVPDVSTYSYDYEHQKIQKQQSKMVLNPDDACAIACALIIKERFPTTHIEIVTMAPRTILPNLLDVLRLPIDTGTMISDDAFAGSDTYATSTILSTYIKDKPYDMIFSGTRSLDGSTAHVPGQLAEILGIDHMMGVISFDIAQISTQRAIFQIEDETYLNTYEMEMPGIVGFTRESRYTLPYISYEDFHKDVSYKLTIISNNELKCSESEIGLEGSLTKVVHTFYPKHTMRDPIVVKVNDEGIDFVYAFLKSRGYI